VDWREIEHLRVDGFPLARRGYDRRDVDKFLAALVDWIQTDAAKDLGDLTVKRKLELVGKSTAQILLATEKESEELRAQTEGECAELRSRAEAASLEARRAADEYAKKVSQEADLNARKMGETASAKARAIVEEAERRRTQIEAVIAELNARRDGTLRELERLRGQLAATIGEHTSVAHVRGRSGEEKSERADAKTVAAAAKPPKPQ
jgi:hypothetical protein